MASNAPRCFARPIALKMGALAALAAGVLVSPEAMAQTCDSTNPNDWPAPSRPYFMLVVDTSGSMNNCTNPATNDTWGDQSCNESLMTLNSCGLEPTRYNDAKCALQQTVLAFGGEVNFGLETFARRISNCPAGTCGDSCGSDGSCPGSQLDSGEDYGCTLSNFPDPSSSGSGTCGNDPDCSTTNAPIFGDNWRNGGNVVVPLLQDPTWGPNPPSTNVPNLLEWFDNTCGDNKELWANGYTPLEGSLRTAHQYLAYGWDSNWQDGNYCTGSVEFPSPIDSVNDRPCRSINVLLVTDGAESCSGNPSNAAADLYNTGVTIQGQQVSVNTFVIGFAGAPASQVDPIADAGDDGVVNGSTNALVASDETELAKALAEVISGAIQPETCDNTDNNCNGCIDEGFVHYCNQNPTCCSWANDTERDQCLSDYEATITSGNPLGDQALLPCTTPTQAGDRTTGLCYNPGDVCDDIDNDCDSVTDEGQTKCGSPPHCPVPETCNSQDDDCDGVVDNDPATPGVPFSICGGCQPAPEICDGCDNDCDGDIDEDIAPVTCGFADPPQCDGTQTCIVTTGVTPGTCTGTGGQFGACNNNPGTETCNGEDDNCNGVIDDSPTDTGGSCIPAGQPSQGQCSPGTEQCQNGALVCVGYQGPRPEICDGLDNDCDGDIDESDGNDLPGEGIACGTTEGLCTPGTTLCVGGTIICDGGTQPSPELCDGDDNDCDGLTDEGPLSDGPAEPGCWNSPGTTCSFGGVSWDPPAGATCTDVSTLQDPCDVGTLLCQGGAWACVGSTLPGVEECNGQDDDCDGQIDNGAPPPGTTCGTDIGECEFGTAICTDGVTECTGGVGPAPELCDGLDNDCNGLVDDNVPGVGIVCGSDIGECTRGITSCVGGEIVCNGEVPPGVEVCDGLDNNCDGAVDNALSDAPTDPGCWNVPGTSCSFDSLTWDPPPGGTCTGTESLTSPCFAGRLVCQGLGGWACIGGQLPAASESCDGIDNDCNGAIDDGNPDGGGQCGSTDVGECSYGSETCVNGTLVCRGNVEPTPELCDDKDNDCDGETDEGAPGTGNPCGVTTGACEPGLTECVGGVLLCQGGTPASPETCNGIDDDCNGIADDGMLQDAPSDYDCWDNPGTTCSFANVTWDPPAGANCQDLGSLSSACALGKLSCAGANLWTCVGGQLPVPEVCDGADNDCDGLPDDGDPGGGGQCGTDLGICEFGVQACQSGVLACTGGVQPTTETCNGLDDDCDGTIDNGIALGDSCVAPYDASAYPNDRTQGECRPGALECDGAGGTRCVGGQGPSPEVCDGKDNDCDGLIDELGPAPDGIDGSVDPFDTSAEPRRLGDACGISEGDCAPGQLVCDDGQVVCAGGIGPQTEICDCRDNDCDGEIDEVDTTASIALCGAPGSKCVDLGGFCQCAEPCGRGEFRCPTNTTCERLAASDGTTGEFCVGESPCQDCETETVRDDTGKVLCTPSGVAPDGRTVPLCECKGLDGCKNPCFGVNCPDGQRCVSTGAFARTCQPADNCNYFGCPAGEACRAGACVQSPCDEDTCPGEVCRPSADFQTSSCSPSCADVTCDGSDESCRDGVCVTSECTGGCAEGEFCAGDTLPGSGCAADPCLTDDGSAPCADGSYCDPVSGACTTDPCAGVVCPSGQYCRDAQCQSIPPAAGGAGGGGGAGGVGGAGGGAMTGGAMPDGGGGGPAAGAGGSDRPEPENERAIFGLATGGGGCACRTARPPDRPTPLALLAALGALVLSTSRRRGRAQGGAR